MITDTHCHLDIMLSFDKVVFDKSMLEPIKTIVDRAIANDVTRLINVGCDIPSTKNSLFFSEVFKNIYAIAGIHPTECNDDWKPLVSELKKVVLNRSKNSKLVAIGEIGLDFYHKPFNAQKQKDAFLAQLDFALEQNFPVQIHVRDAKDELLELLKPYKGQVRGNIHCFQQDYQFARDVIDLGFLIGIDGPIDYPKNDALRQVVKDVSLANILLETDAPFLPPQRFRGKKNEPAYLKIVAQSIADLLGVSLEDVARETTENAIKHFNLDQF